MELTCEQLAAMAATIGLNLPAADAENVRLRLSALLTEMEGIERELGAEQAGINPLLAAGQAERQGRLQQLSALMETGGVERGVEQQANAAEYQDFLRQQGLSEQATFQPFGAFVPSSLGTKTTQSGGGK